jgi:hypothetical protein
MATPLIGTGWGGNQKNTGEMALHLLPTLYSLAHELHIDVALVTNDREVYQLMQWARNNIMLDSRAGRGEKFPYYSSISGDRFLNAEHKQRIHELTRHATRGQLSLFIGAGASMGSNVPDWLGLVASLADELGLTEERKKEFSELDVYTKAEVLEAEVERRQSKAAAPVVATAVGGNEAGGAEGKTLCLGDYVARRFVHSRYSVVHALLASLPVQEVRARPQAYLHMSHYTVRVKKYHVVDSLVVDNIVGHHNKF